MNFNFNNLKVNFFKIYVCMCTDIKSPKSLANFNQLLDHLYVCTHTDCVCARAYATVYRKETVPGIRVDR